MNNLKTKSTQEIKDFIGGFGMDYLQKGKRNFMIEYKAIIATSSGDRIVPKYFEEFNEKLEACRILEERKSYAKKKDLESLEKSVEITMPF